MGVDIGVRHGKNEPCVGERSGCRLGAAGRGALRRSTLVNQYREATGPWAPAKTDPQATGRALYVALQAISGLHVLWAPVLPFTSQTVRELLGEDGPLFGELAVREFNEATRSHLALTYDGAMAAGRWERALSLIHISEPTRPY